jgi:hypothetical protein
VAGAGEADRRLPEERNPSGPPRGQAARGLGNYGLILRGIGQFAGFFMVKENQVFVRLSFDFIVQAR